MIGPFISLRLVHGMNILVVATAILSSACMGQERSLRFVNRSAVSQNQEEGVGCASVNDIQSSLKPLSAISLNIRRESSDLPSDCYLQHRSAMLQRLTATNDARDGFHYHYCWVPFGLAHKPLYTEDVPLERYGQSCSPFLQPAVSTLRFYQSLATLPYRMGVDSPCELNYTLGYVRPGTCARSVKEHLPWSWKGAALQATAVTGGVYLFP